MFDFMSISIVWQTCVFGALNFKVSEHMGNISAINFIKLNSCLFSVFTDTFTKDNLNGILLIVVPVCIITLVSLADFMLVLPGSTPTSLPFRCRLASLYGMAQWPEMTLFVTVTTCSPHAGQCPG